MAYVVLVAGEHWGVSTGKRWLGQHCSLGHIGKAYEQMVTRLGPERVIVIAQLQETIEWLAGRFSRRTPLSVTGAAQH